MQANPAPPTVVEDGQTGPDKRARIMNAARAVFMAVGYANASMDAITREAGVSKATVYAHFGSKAQLFGVEEGLHNRHLSAKFGTGYVYTLREANADGTPLHGMQLVHSMEHRLASEEEIESWKKSVQSASNANANH